MEVYQRMWNQLPIDFGGNNFIAIMSYLNQIKFSPDHVCFEVIPIIIGNTNIAFLFLKTIT